jgi:hypothetical protein
VGERVCAGSNLGFRFNRLLNFFHSSCFRYRRGPIFARRVDPVRMKYHLALDVFQLMLFPRHRKRKMFTSKSGFSLLTATFPSHAPHGSCFQLWNT